MHDNNPINDSRIEILGSSWIIEYNTYKVRLGYAYEACAIKDEKTQYSIRMGNFCNDSLIFIAGTKQMLPVSDALKEIKGNVPDLVYDKIEAYIVASTLL